MALIVVEAVPAVIKSSAADDSIRISTGGKCGLNASAPPLTRASPMHFSGADKKGSAIMPKLVKLVVPPSTLAEELSPCFARPDCSALRLRVFVTGFTSASAARRSC